MSLFGKPRALGSGGFFSQSQPAQPTQPTQPTGNAFGQTLGAGQQGAAPGAPAVQPSQQVQQMPVLAQSVAQLSSSLWQPGKETPRKCRTVLVVVPGWRLT